MNISLKQVENTVEKFSNGYVVWEGFSKLDNNPIVAIATGFNRSKNRKTGDMIQVWIIRSDTNPIDAVYSGGNFSVCGNCKHKPNNENSPNSWGTCYLNLGQAVLQVYKAYKRGSYPKMSSWNIFSGKNVRIGSYGDPAALPTGVVASIAVSCKRHTAYTHQWKTCDKYLRNIVMASVDTPEEMTKAQKMGWRTFRVRTPDETVQTNERICPASDERKLVTCSECMACHGGGNQKASIVILSHGSWKGKRFALIRKLQKMHKAFRHLLAPSKIAVAQRVKTIAM